MKDEEGERNKNRESGGVIEGGVRRRGNKEKESENGSAGVEREEEIVKDVGRKTKQCRMGIKQQSKPEGV